VIGSADIFPASYALRSKALGDPVDDADEEDDGDEQ
jgi:hypothetical protein